MKINKKFIEHIENNCYVGDTDGKLFCNKCNNIVIIDWFEQILTCTGCDDL